MPWTRVDYRPRPKRSTLRHMRENGARSVIVYCGNAQDCQHSAILNLDEWADEIGFSEMERRFVCSACGHRGADMRPQWNNWRPVR